MSPRSLRLAIPRWPVFAAGVALLLGTACGSEPETNALAEAGRSLAVEKGCASCHSVDGSRSVGPTWKGLFGSKVQLEDGRTVIADDAYLTESMLAPSAKTVKGFQAGLMETVIKPGSLTQEEVRALIAYIKTLE